jgi:SAM-dependent methyltransferase
VDNFSESQQSVQQRNEERLGSIENRLAQLANWASDPVQRLTRVRAASLSQVQPPPCEQPLPANYTQIVGLTDGRSETLDLRDWVVKDSSPIPATFDREGYCGDDHLGFWATGLVDFIKVRDSVDRMLGREAISLLDLGCASGRFLRHPAFQQPNWTLAGCDIDAMNVAWVKQYLPPTITAFQNTVYPHLPFPDASFDVITAFSVFTHLDKLEDAWLLEIRRILKPGGIFYVTAHTQRVWKRIGSRPPTLNSMLRCRAEWSIPSGLTLDESLFQSAMPADYIVLRFQEAGAYVAQAFHSDRYIHENWGRLFDVLGIHDAYHNNFQDVVLLRKRA